jgi:hypothetical protein
VNRVKVNVAVLTILTLLLAACSSIPKPGSQDSTLLVVHSTKEIQTSGGAGLDFWLYMEDGTRYQIRFPSSDGFTFIKDIAPGTAESTMLRAALKSGIKTQGPHRYFDYPLRVETRLVAGSYTIFPVTIVYRVVMTAQRHYEFDIDFGQIGSAEMREIVNRLEGMGIADDWSRTD